jgi:uncharacterized protein (TIGR02145 family)/uncharacterized repeat protein (TIGR02543 family)
VYSVTYSGNGNTGGSIPTDATTYAIGGIVTVLDNTGNLTKSNYSFDGWNTNAAGTGTQRTPGSTFLIGSVNVTLYAKWAPNTFVVTFDGQGATVAPNPGTKSVTVPATTVGTLPTPPTKTSYVFDGWWTGANGGGTAFTASSGVTRDITVYAKWVIKDRDGNVYTEVTIGTQMWLVQNLKTTKYNDGSAIPLMTDSASWAALTTPGYCWHNNDVTNKATYGALYNWYTVGTGKLAPVGWHVSTDPEWLVLVDYFGGFSKARGKLKEAGTAHCTVPDSTATNESGFTGLPGGIRFHTGNFSSLPLGTWGSWWTTRENGRGAEFWDFSSDFAGLEQYDMYKAMGFSVRCVRDR